MKKVESYSDIAEAILESARGKGTEGARSVARFLAKKGLLRESENILAEAEKIENRKEGKVPAKLFSPHAPSTHLKHELSEMLRKRYSAKEIEWHEFLDPALLGGFRIEAEGEVIDATIKGKIKKLQAYLTN